MLARDYVVTPAPAAMLLDIKGIGPEFAGIPLGGGALPTLRQPATGRRVCGPRANSLAGGAVDREQGVSKAGNPRLRTDSRLLETAAIALDPFFEPQGERRARLVAHPQPRQLEQCTES